MSGGIFTFFLCVGIFSVGSISLTLLAIALGYIDV
jgi:hypothetical protein